MRPCVSFDVDDVLANFYKKLHALGEALHPQYGPLPVSSGWDAPNWPLSRAEYSLLCMTWKGMPDFYADLELCDGVDPEYINRLAKHTHLIFTTSRHVCTSGETSHKQTVEWLRKQFHIADPNVVVTDDKPAVLRAARAILHVDDKPSTLAALAHGGFFAWDCGMYVHTVPVLYRSGQNIEAQPGTPAAAGIRWFAEDFQMLRRQIHFILAPHVTVPFD